MRANKAFIQLLALMNVDLSKAATVPSARSVPSLIRVGDSTFLSREYSNSKHISLDDFPDLTGYECFINHVHIPFHGDRNSLLDALTYVEGLQSSLSSLKGGDDFVIILSISGNSSVVRFHKNRQGEAWLAPDLEGYEEPVGTFDLQGIGSQKQFSL